MEYLDTALTFAVIIAIVIYAARKFNKIDALSKKVDELEKTIRDMQDRRDSPS